METEEQTPKKKDTELRDLIINFVGNKILPANNEITIQHISDVFTDEFPEFLLSMTEESWVNGYTQALTDMDFMVQQQLRTAEAEKKSIEKKRNEFKKDN